jgi:hypothetical protein
MAHKGWQKRKACNSCKSRSNPTKCNWARDRDSLANVSRSTIFRYPRGAGTFEVTLSRFKRVIASKFIEKSSESCPRSWNDCGAIMSVPRGLSLSVGWLSKYYMSLLDIQASSVTQELILIPISHSSPTMNCIKNHDYFEVYGVRWHRLLWHVGSSQTASIGPWRPKRRALFVYGGRFHHFLLLWTAVTVRWEAALGPAKWWLKKIMLWWTWWASAVLTV